MSNFFSVLATPLQCDLIVNFLFTEFDIERRYIWNEVLPNVQHHCLQLGLDVIFVDMLLGDQKDPLLDNNNYGIRIKELEICAEESIGPFFLVSIISLGNSGGGGGGGGGGAATAYA